MIGNEAKLGGAPLNMAVHAHQLGDQAVVATRVGQDRLGRSITDELTSRNMSVDYVQTDPDRPTGTVLVSLNEQREAEYDFVTNVAWDNLQYDPDLETLAKNCDAICFGTLAQRNGQTRNTIYRVLEIAKQALKLFDINLRPPYYDRKSIERSCILANALKVNEAELQTLGELFNCSGDTDATAHALTERFGLDWIALTRGKDGTCVFANGRRTDGTSVQLHSTEGDSIGAGDATSAALLHGRLHRWPWEQTLLLANTLGAHVAGETGACPKLSNEIIEMAAG